jgi:hypothetical protein
MVAAIPPIRPRLDTITARRYRRTLLRLWIAFLFFFLTLWMLLDHWQSLPIVIDRVAGVVLVLTFLYVVGNKSEIKRIQSYSEFRTFREVVEGEPLAKRCAIGICVIEAIICATYFLMHKDLGELLNSYWSLWLFFLLPFIPAVIVNQVKLYRQFGRY